VIYHVEPPKAYSWYRTCGNKFFVDVVNSKNFRGKVGGVAYYIASDSGNLPVVVRKQLFEIRQPLLSHSLLLPVTQDVVFIPDFHYISYDGYVDLVESMNKYNGEHSFASKDPIVFWRGSPSALRTDCVNRSLPVPYLNMGLSSMKKGNFSEQTLGGIYKERVPEHGWIRHRGILDIDGHVNAWGLYWRLASRSVVFKVDSNFTNYYISRMEEGVHYLKIERNLCNLAEIAAIVTSNDSNTMAKMANIAKNAYDLSTDVTYLKEVIRVASEVAVVFGTTTT
jgi:hypothetical protein